MKTKNNNKLTFDQRIKQFRLKRNLQFKDRTLKAKINVGNYAVAKTQAKVSQKLLLPIICHINFLF